MTAHRVRIAHCLETLGCCLLLLALFTAGFSDAQAATVVIDTFDGPDQQAPPDNEIDVPSAIGGKRNLVSDGEIVGIVADGKWNSIENNPPGGAVSAIYRGDGTLGGIDLSDGGSNALFEIVLFGRNFDFQGESLVLTVTDSSAVQGTFSIDWDELPLAGSYFIPFSSLAGGADLTSVDMITVRNEIPGLTGESRFISISEIRVVPEPSRGTVIRDGGRAIGIDGLEVAGALYNVTFVFEPVSALYGQPPGVFRFDSRQEAAGAIDAINASLNDAGGIDSVGPNGVSGYGVGYSHFNFGGDMDVLIEGDGLIEAGTWVRSDEPSGLGWSETSSFAQFELVGGTTTTTTVAVTTTTSAGTTTTSAGTTTTSTGTTTTSAGTTTTSAGTTTTSAGTTTTTAGTTTTATVPALCSDAPIKGCFVADKGSLKVNEKKIGKESAKFQLQKFDGATTQAEFGDPLAAGGTAYEICIWTPDGFVERLLVDRASQTCGKKSKPCWKDKQGKGWDYKDDLAASDGVKKIKLQSGDAGKGKIQADAANKAKKDQTALPTGVTADLQGATIALVQVTGTDAACFQALLTDVKKNDAVKFEAKVAKDGGDDGGSGSLCDEGLCAMDDTLAQQCEDFVEACLTFEEVNEEECAGGAILICEGGPPPDVNPGNVCSRELCETDTDLATECQMFLDTCLAAGEPEEDCVGAALFICEAEE